MKVSISKAATMAGVTRATFYRHIEKKGITVEKDNAGNPQIDVSELIRVYGDKVRTPEQVEKDKAKQPARQNREADTELRVEVEVLREKLRGIENERNRERDQLCAQIDLLKKSLEKAQEQAGRLTALLTDQRGKGEESCIIPESGFPDLPYRERLAQFHNMGYICSPVCHFMAFTT